MRFNVKTLLLAFALIAVWLSTFAGYRGADDVRPALLIVVLIGSGCLAICRRGRRRAFWAGFFAAMLIATSGVCRELTPRLSWTATLTVTLANYLPNRPGVVAALHVSLWAVSIIVIASLVGFVCSYIYTESQTPHG